MTLEPVEMHRLSEIVVGNERRLGRFIDQDEFRLFVAGELNKFFENYVRAGDTFRQQVFDFIRELDAEGSIPNFIDRLYLRIDGRPDLRQELELIRDKLKQVDRLTISEPRIKQRQGGTKIFISYRRLDTEHVSGRIFDTLIFDTLIRHFPQEDIYYDVQTTPPGVNFEELIHSAIESSAVVLVIIGREWVNSSWARKQRSSSRDKRQDFVLEEIERALEVGVPILPILIGDTPMPDTSALPKSIRSLAKVNATQVRAGRDFPTDMRRVVDAIKHFRKQGESFAG